MKVELLYFNDCPNWRQTLKDVNEVLKETHVDAEVQLVQLISDQEAHDLAFLGSPTVRVDDVDVEPGIPDSRWNADCTGWMTNSLAGRQKSGSRLPLKPHWSDRLVARLWPRQHLGWLAMAVFG